MSNKPPILQVADAIAELIGEQCPTLCVARRNLPEFTLEELAAEPRVMVMPVSVASEIQTRHSVLDVLTIHVLVYAIAQDDEAVDFYIKMCEQISTLLAFRNLAGAAWIGVEVSPIFDPALLNQNARQFTSVITSRYRKRRVPSIEEVEPGGPGEPPGGGE